MKPPVDLIKDSLEQIEIALEYLEKTDQKNSCGDKCYLISEEWLIEIEKAVHKTLYNGKYSKKNSVIHHLTYDTNQHI